MQSTKSVLLAAYDAIRKPAGAALRYCQALDLLFSKIKEYSRGVTVGDGSWRTDRLKWKYMRVMYS